jgi:hypothetical protein
MDAFAISSEYFNMVASKVDAQTPVDEVMENVCMILRDFIIDFKTLRMNNDYYIGELAHLTKQTDNCVTGPIMNAFELWQAKLLAGYILDIIVQDETGMLALSIRNRMAPDAFNVVIMDEGDIAINTVIDNQYDVIENRQFAP